MSASFSPNTASSAYLRRYQFKHFVHNSSVYKSSYNPAKSFSPRSLDALTNWSSPFESKLGLHQFGSSVKRSSPLLLFYSRRTVPPILIGTSTLCSQIVTCMGLDITIRAACPSDAEELHAIALCPGVRINTTKMPYMPISKTKRELENPRPEDVKLVAVFENQVVGTIGIHQNPNPARKHAAFIGMAVHDTFQGRGIGTSLLIEAIDLAERWMGLRRLELEVLSQNKRALELYKRHGFEIEGTLKDYVFRAGEFVDGIAMARVNGLKRFSG